MKKKQNTGPDNIGSELVKDNVSILVGPLIYLFNLSMSIRDVTSTKTLKYKYKYLDLKYKYKYPSLKYKYEYLVFIASTDKVHELRCKQKLWNQQSSSASFKFFIQFDYSGTIIWW